MKDLNSQAIRALKLVANPKLEYLDTNQNLFEQEPFFKIFDELMVSTCVEPILEEAIKKDFKSPVKNPNFCQYLDTDVARNWLYAVAIDIAKTLPSEEKDKNMHDYNYMLKQFDELSALKLFEKTSAFEANKKIFEIAAVEFLGVLTDSGIPFFLSYLDHAPIGGSSRGHDYDHSGYPKISPNRIMKPTTYITYASWAGNYLRGLYIGTSEFTNALGYSSPRIKNIQTKQSRFWTHREEIKRRS